MSNRVNHLWGRAKNIFVLCLVTVSLSIPTALSVTSANAASNPFKKLSGSWRSSGATAIIKGNKERVKCRAKYSVPGRNVSISLKCSGPGYFINVRVKARVIGKKVKGSWSESQWGKSGWVSGRASSRSSSMSFAGGGVNGNISISLSSRSRHRIHIRANGNRVSIPLRR